jgi:hypothetical protein
MNRKILIGTFAILVLLLIFYLISDSQKVSNTFRTTTPTFTEISEEQATISAFETKIAEYPSICKNTLSYNFSPDGLWRQEFCVSETDREPTLTVSNRETKVLWKMIYRDYVPNSTLLDGGMSVSHWSSDGKYAYFNSYMYGDGGGCFVPYSDGGWGLFRLDLQTGNVTTILPVADDLTVFYGFSFSPTDKRLAYRVKQENIVILDMTTEESLKVNHIKDFDDEGGYLWSKDGLRFVYSTGTFTSESEIYSLRLVDVLTGNEQLLLESNGSCYLTMEWDDNDRLLVEQNEPYGQVFRLNSERFPGFRKPALIQVRRTG